MRNPESETYPQDHLDTKSIASSIAEGAYYNLGLYLANYKGDEWLQAFSFTPNVYGEASLKAYVEFCKRLGIDPTLPSDDSSLEPLVATYIDDFGMPTQLEIVRTEINPGYRQITMSLHQATLADQA